MDACYKDLFDVLVWPEPELEPRSQLSHIIWFGAMFIFVIPPVVLILHLTIWWRVVFGKMSLINAMIPAAVLLYLMYISDKVTYAVLYIVVTFIHFVIGLYDAFLTMTGLDAFTDTVAGFGIITGLCLGLTIWRFVCWYKEQWYSLPGNSYLRDE